MNTKSKNNSGFTLIEVLITMGMLTLMAGIVGTLSMSDYFAYDFRAERNLAVSLLQKARAQAIANVNQSEFGHGVFIDTANDRYVLYEPQSDPTVPPDHGYIDSVDSNYEIKFFSAKVTHTGMTHVVFSSIDGKAVVYNIDPSCQIPLVTQLCLDGIKSVISINPEGQIQWTN